MRIVIGCDHRGIDTKQLVTRLITEAGYSYQDFGCFTTSPVDYPDIAKQVSEAVASGEFDQGVLICGTGIGMSIAANKVKGIRAALCHDSFSASRARHHNDANILCLGAEVDPERIPETLRTFFTTRFDGGKHLRRVGKIRGLEG